MALTAYSVVVLFWLTILIGISIKANRSLPPSATLPMQWGFDGRPTWSAPRTIALNFTPSLYFLVSLAMSFLLPNQWGSEVPAMLGVFTFVGASFAGAHLFHVKLIRQGGWKRKD